MRNTFAVVFLFLVACSGADSIESKIRVDALTRAGSDCGATNSCRVAISKIGDGWDVRVEPTSIGNAGDPQFIPGNSHHYAYDASGAFIGDVPGQ